MLQSIISKYRELFPPIPEEIQREFRQIRPFYILVELALALIYGLTLRGDPSLWRPSILVPFTLLMILHGWLHWHSPRLVVDKRFLGHYLVIQGALAFIIILVIGNVGMILGLFMALIGEAFGMLQGSRLGLVTIVGYLILSVLGYAYIEGVQTLWIWGLTAIPVVIFVMIYVSMFNRQIRAREQAQTLATQLEDANRQLSEYAAQVEDLTIATERQRMARELHDTLSQGLAGLILQLEAIDAYLSADRIEKAQAIARQSMQQARSTLADARRVIDDLRRSQPLDLESALRLETSRFSAATDIPCILQNDVHDPIPSSVQEAVQRSVAEALTNIARHAQARHASVALSQGEGDLIIEIRDDGVGFDATAVPAGHYGLLGMRERMRMLDGTMDIESAPGQGTLLRLCLPVKVE